MFRPIIPLALILSGVLAALMGGPLHLHAQKEAKPYRPESRDFALWQADRLDGWVTAFTYATLLAGPERWGSPGISVAWGVHVTASGDTTWLARVGYRGEDWAFIGAGDSPAIEFLADGERVTPGRAASPRYDLEVGPTRGVVVVEAVTTALTSAQLFQLARADSVYWRAIGQDRYLEGDANPENLERLRRFLATFHPDSTLLVKECSGRRRDRCT